MSISLLIFLLCILGLTILFGRSVYGTISEDILWGFLAICLIIWIISLTPIDLTPLRDRREILYVFLLIFIHIFSDDLRRNLRSIGKRINPKILLAPPERPSQTVTDELSHGLFFLARQSMGAIIIVEQRANLNSFIEGGVPINAKLTASLLYAIFNKDNRNPLHDGAVIVRGDQIIMAATFLPMTRSLNLEVHMGARHRAALGISEETDSIVLVVSEERGEVSIAYGGQLYEITDIRQLQIRLKALMTSNALI